MLQSLCFSVLSDKSGKRVGFATLPEPSRQISLCILIFSLIQRGSATIGPGKILFIKHSIPKLSFDV